MKLVTIKIITVDMGHAKEIYGEIKAHLRKYNEETCGGTLPFIYEEASIKDVVMVDRNEKKKNKV